MATRKEKRVGGKGSKVKGPERTRRLFVIDIENYCGKAVLSEADVVAARDALRERFAPLPFDLIVIGTSHTRNLLNVGMAWRGARLVMMKGHDGADRALISALGEYQFNRFGEVVLFSGDGIFVKSVKEITAKGAKVVVASHKRCLSKNLAKAAPCLRLVGSVGNVHGIPRDAA